ncbi:50S ribosomal protein L15 [Desulfovibrionales bacterium]
MNLHELYPFPEERVKPKRVGRGTASGQGSTAGKGHKGQNARSGGGVAPWFEGGQMCLYRRLPKRGFKNPFRTTYQVVNVGDILSKFDSAEISLDDLYTSGLVRTGQPVKILSGGDVQRAVKLTAHKFSSQAIEKISASGGEAIALEG